MDFTFNPLKTTILDVGKHIQEITFIPKNTKRFENATTRVEISIVAKPLHITWASPDPIDISKNHKISHYILDNFLNAYHKII